MKPNHPQAHRPQGQRPHRPENGRRPAGSPGARRVLRWLTSGHDLAAIARRLGRDEQGLQQRLSAMFKRLGVDSPQAALAALQAAHASAPAAAVPAEAPVADEFSDVPGDAVEAGDPAEAVDPAVAAEPTEAAEPAK